MCTKSFKEERICKFKKQESEETEPADFIAVNEFETALPLSKCRKKIGRI